MREVFRGARINARLVPRRNRIHLLPAESVGRIFDRFYRAPNQEKRSGAGLGLAIAREIIVAHGGSIACTSVEGEGSEFYFVVPR